MGIREKPIQKNTRRIDVKLCTVDIFVAGNWHCASSCAHDEKKLEQKVKVKVFFFIDLLRLLQLALVYRYVHPKIEVFHQLDILFFGPIVHLQS